MAHPKQILVLESETLLTNSVVNILSSRTEYDVSSVTFTERDSIDLPNGREPEVLILDQADLEANIKDVMDLVSRHPNVRLIILGLNDNLLHIFEQQIVQVAQVSDFLEQL